MTRVLVVCEGQTEETFVNEVLARALAPHQIYLSARLIGRPGHKGGNIQIQRLLHDIRAVLASDPNVYCTTFFDFYGLPGDFPGKTEADALLEPAQKAAHINEGLRRAVHDRLGQNTARRFIPYVQLYEFEALLFSDTAAFTRGIGAPSLLKDLEEIRRAFPTPEHINDSPQTAPSKRITDLHDDYDKPRAGVIGALEIGLTTIRAQCPLFDGWIKQLEAL